MLRQCRGPASGRVYRAATITKWFTGYGHNKRKEGADMRLEVMKERVVMWFVWMLPRWLVKWCVVRAVAYATTGKWSGQIVPELTAMDALERWDDEEYWEGVWNAAQRAMLTELAEARELGFPEFQCCLNRIRIRLEHFERRSANKGDAQ